MLREQANGEADAIRARAQAEADAIRLRGASASKPERYGTGSHQ